jgi:hypothetical protein
MHSVQYVFAVVLCSITLCSVTAAPSQLAKLTPADGASGDEFGEAIAVKGNLAVISAPFHAVGANIQQGAAYIYEKHSGDWKNATQTLTLTASDGAAYDIFGYSVAIDGDTVVVGAPTRLNPDQGSVYVFVRSGSNFKQAAKLTASDGFAGDGLGFSVAIAGNTIMAGEIYASQNGINGAGATYVFVEPSTGWADGTETAKLTASDPNVGAFVGSSLSFDGETVVVGATGAAYSGEAYVYMKPAGGWTNGTETAKLTPTDGVVNGFFGYSVALSGKTILVGSPGAGPNSNGFGAGYIFVKPRQGWANATQNAKLTASNLHAFDSLGTSVSLVGGKALMGAPNVWFGNSTGKAYIYLKPAGGWTNTSTFDAELKSKDRRPTDQFGVAVALDRTTEFVGAMSAHYSGGNPGPGATYVFGQ